ncbi:hypothetical protein CH360_18510, partial [Leptospira perolatii]
ISQDQLVGYVNQLRNFFIEKQSKGEEVNTAVLEALENTGAFTDEMAKLKFFQGLPTADRTEAVTLQKWNEAKASTTNIKEAQVLFRDLKSTLENLDHNGQPMHTAMDQIEASLAKYEVLKTKLASGNYELSSEITNGMESLKEYAWEAHKGNLTQAFLATSQENVSLDEFLTALKAGKYVLPGQNGGRVERSSKFLGQNLTDSQLADLKDSLKVYADQLKITNTNLGTNIDAILTVTDPQIRETLKAQALALNYDRIQTSLAQGTLVNVSALQPELKEYGIVSNYQAFLSSNKNWNESSEADRISAKNEYLLRVGTGNGEDTILADYLTNYTNRNSAYYLKTESLQQRDALAAYYNDATANTLKADDLTALTNWLKDKKYEPSLVTSLNKSVRMETILSGYVGETEEEYFTYLGTKLSGGITDSEKEGLILAKAGLYDPFSSMNPFRTSSADQFLKSFAYKTGFTDFVTKLGTEDVSFTKQAIEANRTEQNQKFAYDIVKKNVIVESYLSYINIGPKGQLEPSDDQKITDRLRELEYQAEQRLGNFLGLVEGYKSVAFDPSKEEANPSIRRALRDFKDTGYEIKDTVYSKNASGDYSFKGGLDNLY